MNRPVVLAFVSMIMGVSGAEYGLRLLAAEVLIFAAVMTFLTCRKKEIKAAPVVLCVIFFAAGYFCMRETLEIHREMERIGEGENVEIDGVLNQVRDTEYGVQLNISIIGEKECVVYCDESLGDRETLTGLLGCGIKVSGKKKAFKTGLNPGEFDERQFYYSTGVIIKLKGEEVTFCDGEANEFKVWMGRLRIKFESILNEICDEREKGIFAAMLYGDRSELDGDMKRLFQSGGISHILSISGLHISILGMGVYRILRRRLSLKTSSAISITFMILYGIMTGGGVSAIRAVIMYIVHLAAKLSGRDYDIKSAMSLAGIILLFKNPYCIFNTGCVLSFGGVIGAGWLMPELEEMFKSRSSEKRRFSDKCEKLWGMLLTSVSINLINGPMLVNAYHELPLYGVFLNIPVIMLMSVAVLSGFLGLVCGSAGALLGKIAIYPGVIIIRIYEAMCEAVEKLPYSKIVTGHFDAYETVIYYAVLTGALWCMKNIKNSGKNDKKRMGERFRVFAANHMKIWCGIVCAFLNIMLFTSHKERNIITFLAVGQGDSAVFVSGGGTVCLFDGGSSSDSDVGKNIILPFLKYSGIGQIDFIVLSHSDVDHTNGICHVMEDGGIHVKNLVLSSGDDGFGDIIDVAEELGINIIRGDASLNIEDEAMSVEFINPPKTCGEMENIYSDINDCSLVGIIRNGGCSVVMTGDISEKAEKVILEKCEKTDILKVPHHGSKNSSSEEFLEILKPELSVISCGEGNMYGHPHIEALDRLNMYSGNIKITYETGAIIVRMKDGEAVTDEYN